MYRPDAGTAAERSGAERLEGTHAMPRSPIRAFTLFELLLVVALLVILAGAALLNLGAMQTSRQLNESVDRMKTLVAMCRAQAMNESRRYRVTFAADGTVQVTQQLDPIEAPHEYVAPKHPWALTEAVLDGVWVEGVQPLPSGPAPILVDDEKIEFTELDDEPAPVADFETPATIEFEPDGSANSIIWVLRDRRGRGFKMTLDGRLGRIGVEQVESLPEDQVREPERIEESKETAEEGSK
jgi:type II secretory pathway pseudopilin PulG